MLQTTKPDRKAELVDTQEFYINMYESTNYAQGIGDVRPAEHAALVRCWMIKSGVTATTRMLEVGAGHGDMHDIHPGWRGMEYSSAAIAQGVGKYGPIALTQGDATAMQMADDSVDFLFSFATLEHIPDVEKALLEICRVLAPGRTALLAPAWNCRPWTVEKLQQRPYGELTLRQKIGKFLIPLREHLLFRMMMAMPKRVWREMRSLFGPVKLDYQALHPQWELFERYPHISDDDAFVNMDAHAAMVYLRSRGYTILSHPHLLSRLMCRGEAVVIQKPHGTVVQGLSQ